ncbi:MAG TPA: amino acid ABC transporter permease [Ktedonobacterales bacterium]|nr:amino acid ABC transporter permease [Ktedonobacterales bacterium]
MNPILQFLQQIFTLRGSFNWDYVWGFLFSPDILQGVLITVILSLMGQVIGSLIGLGLYFLRRSRTGALRTFANAYIWFFRGTPLLVQILFLYAFMPYVGLARPLINTHFFRHLGFTIDIPFDAFIAAAVALAFNEGAYMSEIVRAGIDSIDIGQLEAARSLGMTYGRAMRRIVLPQAMRVIIPPLGNEFNSMLKSSSLAYTIGASELLFAAYSHSFALGAPLELYTVAVIWYLVLTTIWSFVQAMIERRFNASTREPGMPNERSWWRRYIGFGLGAPVPAPAGIPTEAGAPGLGERR